MPYRGKQLHPIPARTDDDRQLLGLALERGAYILTNDNYDKYVADGTISAEWREAHLLKYFWLGDELKVVAKEGQTHLRLR
eukprot:5121576-Prymnesium_polylepis.1